MTTFSWRSYSRDLVQEAIDSSGQQPKTRQEFDGLVRYEVIVDPKKLKPLVEKRGPVEATLLTLSTQLPENFVYLKDLLEIAKELISYRYGRFVGHIIVQQREKQVYTFQPFFQEKSIHIYRQIVQPIYLSQYAGYAVFLNHSLGLYIALRYFDFEDIKEILPNLTIIKIRTLPETLKIKQKAQYRLSQLLQDNSFLTTSILSSEIAHLWNHLIIDTLQIRDRKEILIQSPEMNINAQKWHSQSTDEIENNLIPKWSISASLDLEVSLENRLRRMYQAIVAYSKVVDKYDVLSSFIYELTVTSNLEILAHFGLPEHLDYFREILTSVQEDQINTFIRTEAVENIAIYRYLLPNAKPLGIKIDDQYYLVALGSQEIPKLNSKGLVEALRGAFNKCLNQEDLITLESIDQMSLDQLLRLVPIQEADTVYCMTTDTVSKLVSPTNPFTRNPISENILAYYTYIDYGIMGYYPIGPLEGLMETPVKRTIKIVEVGEPKVSSLINEEVQYVDFELELRSSDFLIYEEDVDETEGTEGAEGAEAKKETINLFTAMVPLNADLKEIEDRFTQVWRSGLLLSPWCYLCLQSRGKLSRYIILRNEILSSGVEMISKGDRLLNYLRRLEIMGKNR